MKYSRFNKKGFAIDEFIPLLVFVILAALVILGFKWFGAQKTQEIEVDVEKSREIINANINLREFITLNYDKVIEAYDKAGFFVVNKEIQKSAEDFFYKKYDKKLYVWRLEVRDSKDKLEINVEPFDSRSYRYGSVTNILPIQKQSGKDYLKIKLYVGSHEPTDIDLGTSSGP